MERCKICGNKITLSTSLTRCTKCGHYNYPDTQSTYDSNYNTNAPIDDSYYYSNDSSSNDNSSSESGAGGDFGGGGSTDSWDSSSSCDSSGSNF